MFALILWLTIGPRVAAAELFVELATLLVYWVIRARATPAWPLR